MNDDIDDAYTLNSMIIIKLCLLDEHFEERTTSSSNAQGSKV